MIIVYNMSLFFTKMAILMQYKRLFPQKGFKIAVNIAMVIVIIYAFWRVFAAIFVCWPVAACEYSIVFTTIKERGVMGQQVLVTDLVIYSLGPFDQTRSLSEQVRECVSVHGSTTPASRHSFARS